MKTYVPMVSYRYARTDDKWTRNEERKSETRTRHWNIVWWEDEAGKHTADFGVITEHMPDFCGGLIVCSPYVNTYNERGAWNNHFAAPGNPDPGEEVATEWKQFDPDQHAVDLVAFTGQEKWDNKTVTEYLFECMAAQIAGEMCYHGKRGIMAADYTGGRMTRLIDAMSKMGEFICTPVERWKLERVGQDELRQRYVKYGTTEPSTYSFAARWWVFRGPQWYNANSGNNVHWLQAGLSAGGEPPEKPTGDSNYVFCSDCDWEYNRQDYSECPECGYDEYYHDDYDEDPANTMLNEAAWPIHKALRVMQGNYAARARRHFWRNG